MAKEIRLENLRKEYDTDSGTITANDDVDLTIPEGKFTTIVGPSGCGKTTMLRLIAGLQDPTSGRIYFGGEDVTEVPPQNRGISMVFQNIALFPHMTVRENMAYGLKIDGVPKEQRDERVEEAAEMLQIEDQVDKKPDALSGGQQQRVALGAAFVTDPEILLFDEPMSDLDAKLRAELRVEVQQLHQRLDTTVVYVTHDQTEAMTMSDTIVTLRDGDVEQIDPPKEMFDRPVSRYVAEFIGTPATNFLAYDVAVDGTPVLEGHGHELRVPDEGLRDYVGRTLEVGIRPQYLTLGGGDLELAVDIDVIELQGTDSVVHATLEDGQPIDFVTEDTEAIEAGDSVTIGFDREDAVIFAPDGEAIAYGENVFEGRMAGEAAE